MGAAMSSLLFDKAHIGLVGCFAGKTCVHNKYILARQPAGTLVEAHEQENKL
jgi:hypothetical protein